MRAAALILSFALLLGACTTEAPPATVITPSGPPAGVNYRINYGEAELFADSVMPVSDDQLSSFRLLTGKSPVAWGRYLCHFKPEYDLTAAELAVMQRNNVAPFLILQPGQSTLSRGAAEANAAASCLASRIADLKAMGGSLPDGLEIFLDVEKDTALSAAYLEALIPALQRYGVLTPYTRFGIYLSGAYSVQLRDLVNREIARGLPISVLWFNRYPLRNYCGPPQFWQENNIPELGVANVTVEYWQYAAECRAYGGRYPASSFDINIRRPATREVAS
ncbi:MAG: hypothetical protein ISS15_09490 [Alphaproteobacteria bacterium]|nr:hypothetical protein [Alphaproteobacteria bacterium]MBL7097879.1 hypothetical protein [Alphaproteobacteria bacterium]